MAASERQRERRDGRTARRRGRRRRRVTRQRRRGRDASVAGPGGGVHVAGEDFDMPPDSGVVTFLESGILPAADLAGVWLTPASRVSRGSNTEASPAPPRSVAGARPRRRHRRLRRHHRAASPPACPEAASSRLSPAPPRSVTTGVPRGGVIGGFAGTTAQRHHRRAPRRRHRGSSTVTTLQRHRGTGRAGGCNVSGDRFAGRCVGTGCSAP